MSEAHIASQAVDNFTAIRRMIVMPTGMIKRLIHDLPVAASRPIRTPQNIQGMAIAIIKVELIIIPFGIL